MQRTYSYRAYPESDPAPVLEAMANLARAFRTGMRAEDREDGLKLAKAEAHDATAASRELLREWLRAARYFGNTGQGRVKAGGTIGFPMNVPQIGEDMEGLSAVRKVSLERVDDTDLAAEIPFNREGGTVRVRIRLHRPLPAAGSIRRGALHARIGRSGNLTWRVLFFVKLPEAEPRVGVRAGLDLGWRLIRDEGLRIATLAIDGREIEHITMPDDLYYRGLAAFGTQGTRADRARFARSREDAYRKIAHRLYRDHPEIAELRIERLQVHLIPASGDRMTHRLIAAPMQLARILERKGAAEGAKVVWVNPAGTTGMCSVCGHINKRQSHNLVWTCKGCGAQWDQDENAAINVRDRAAIWGAVAAQKRKEQAQS